MNDNLRPSSPRKLGHHAEVDVQGFMSKHKDTVILILLFFGVLIFEKLIGFEMVIAKLKIAGAAAITIAGNILSWLVAGVVVLSAFRLLWPFLRPFVCAALGLITCWVLWRLGLW